jgi:hypothetical protein
MVRFVRREIWNALAMLTGQIIYDDGTVKEDNPFKEPSEFTVKAMRAIDRLWPVADDLLQKLKSAGF